MKSLTYDHGEYHQFDLRERTIEKITASVVSRTLVRMRKGIYTIRSYGRLRLVNSEQRKRGDR